MLSTRFWRFHKRTQFLSYALLLLFLAALVTGCGWFGGNNSQQANSTPTLTVQNQPMRVGALSPTIENITTQVLLNMHLHSWNPHAMTHKVVTGGLYINWEMSNPSVTNAVTPGSDGNPQHNHDPQVDLWYLAALADYHHIHPLDHTFDADISHMTSFVASEFYNYNLPKGWIYFSLLKAGQFLGDQTLMNDAHSVATNYYRHWYDPSLGFVYTRNHSPGDYSPDHTLNCGAALIDAGIRWNMPDWVTAGEKTLDHVIAVALDPTYHMFYNDMTVSLNGHDTVLNPQAKPSTQGQGVDALLTAYASTHLTRYLNAADEVLQALFNSKLVDAQRGGLYFAIDMSKGKLLADYKETRSQTLVLLALHHYNTLVGQHYATQEQQMLTVITNSFYQSTYHGFFYRVTPDFQVYHPSSKHLSPYAVHKEDFFTTEAMGSSLDVLQQTELTS